MKQNAAWFAADKYDNILSKFCDGVLASITNAKACYDTAKSNYWTAKNDKRPDAGNLKTEMDNALKKWQSKGSKDAYEKNMVTASRASKKTPKAYFAKATDVFENYLTEVGYSVSYLPSNWHSPDCQLAWQSITLNELTCKSTVHSDISNVSSSSNIKFRIGFWGASKNSKYEKQVERLNSLATKESFTLKMDIARVDIIRDWFNASLMGYDVAVLPSLKKGSISRHSLRDFVICQMPILPTSMLLAKNIEIYRKFDSEESNFMREIVKSQTICLWMWILLF